MTMNENLSQYGGKRPIFNKFHVLIIITLIKEGWFSGWLGIFWYFELRDSVSQACMLFSGFYILVHT